MKKLLLCISLLFYTYVNYGQDLPKIIPLSPDAASMAKYGEVPVGHFTGVPNIGIPIYTIKSGDLTLPLSLSYHAGGHKVESIASQVGLGWSLGSIPSISRSVRGIPDENGGYFSKTLGKTVKELWELPTGNNTLNSYRSRLFEGTADSEPDIFYYTILGESGKFFYNQESETFLTYPKSNVKITREGNIFRLTDGNGVAYTFNIIETTSSSDATASAPVNATWYASKIASPSKKDAIRLTYVYENQSTKTKSVTTKYQFIGGVNHTNGLSSPNNSLLTNNVTAARVLDSIIFSNGYVKFNRNSIEREDLKGGYSLNNISVYNKHHQLVDKHDFTFRYKAGGGGSSCNNADSYTSTWMLLDKVAKVSTGSSTELTHEFSYNESGSFPCRISAAQDYWGYYNGYTSNTSLTPSYFIPNTTIQVTGANRQVNPGTSNFGILKKIMYPTGGYTELDYENHRVYDEDLPSQYINDSQQMEGGEYFDWNDPIPSTVTFTKQFTINNPPDPILNNNNPNGGANIIFTIGDPGCDLSSGLPNNCARFTVKGVSPVTNTYDITIHGGPNYLPNGTYEMKASFNQSLPNYQDFFFLAEWKKIDPNQTNNKFVGGLRIKEIRSYANATANPITKKYKYTNSYSSTDSSGKIFGTPNFSHTDLIQYDYNEENPQLATFTLTKTLYLRIRSISNMQQISHSGSFVGYNNVIEQASDINKTGYVEYKFSNSKDEYNTASPRFIENFTVSGVHLNNSSDNEVVFPYPPAESREIYRGQLLSVSGYKKSGAGFNLVHQKLLSYTDNAFTSGSLYPKYSLGLKWGNSIISNEGYSPVNGFIYNRAQNITEYYVLSGWNNLKTEIEKQYDIHGQNPITTTTNHFYDNSNHLLRTRTELTNSEGEILKTKTYYPGDTSQLSNLSPEASTAIDNLLAQNRVAVPVQAESYEDTVLLSTQRTNFKDWGNEIILPKTVQNSKKAQLLEDRIVYHRYDSKGNPVEVSKKDGTKVYYVWGYNQMLPIAKIEGHVSITSVQQTAINNAIAASDSDTNTATENILRTRLQELRNSFAGNTAALVTTFTHDSLTGVTSITDPRGETLYYTYDDFNRLLYGKDAYGKMLSKNEYNYKN